MPGGEVNFLAGGEVNFLNTTARIVRSVAVLNVKGMATYKALVVLQTQAVVNAQALILLATVPVNRGSVLIVKELTNLVIAFAQSK